MTTYKNEFEAIEAQEKQLNAQKKQLAKQKRQLKAQLAEEQKRQEKETAKSTKQWFIEYCSKFNINYELDTNYSCGSFLTLAGKSGQKFTEGMDLDGYFESGDKKALKKLVDEFYNQVQAIDALSSILKLSNKYGTDSFEFYTYEISRHGYCAWFNTIYSDIVVYISYVNGTISVNVVYHGTSTNVNVKNKLLPPIATDNLRETFRKKYRDKVFITDSKVSAEKYAKKAVAHFGGEAVIYTVKPDYYSLIKNGTEYTTDYAVVLAKEIK